MENTEKKQESLTVGEFQRLANNFYNSLGMDSYEQRIALDSQLVNYFISNANTVKQRSKVAFVWICLNPLYWEYAKPMIEGARRFFLPGHDVDYFLWSDMPKTKQEVVNTALTYLRDIGVASVVTEGSTQGLVMQQQTLDGVNKLGEDIENLHKMDRVTVFPLEGMEWPMPTLMRYHTFLQQEELLSKYDYIFYADVDLAFVDIVGDEILGESLTCSQNPMYVLDKSMWQPFEPNPQSAAYIKRPGRIIQENGQPRFQPLYLAGGFQGGVASEYIKAMKGCKKIIDKDFANNYISIWNDEGAWNKYVFENLDPQKLVILNPSYIYPDSLIKEYYEPRWSRSYQPKIVTLTKKHSLKPLTMEEQQMLTRMQGMKKL